MIRLTRGEILALHEHLIECFPMASGMRERSRFSSSPKISRARAYSSCSRSEHVLAIQAESGWPSGAVIAARRASGAGSALSMASITTQVVLRSASSTRRDYIHDMRMTQLYAVWNRRAMLDEIAENMGIACEESFTTIHNHIDTDAMILRKGSVRDG